MYLYHCRVVVLIHIYIQTQCKSESFESDVPFNIDDFSQNWLSNCACAFPLF